MKVTIDCDDRQELEQVQQALAGDGQVFVRRALGPELIADQVIVLALGQPVASNPATG